MHAWGEPAPGPRILVHGLQSSGTTFVALVLAQDAGTIGLLDVHSVAVVPPATMFPPGRRVVAKVTVAAHATLGAQTGRFDPDFRVLVLRHPCHTWVSLARKGYANLGGTIEDKFRRYEEVFRDRQEFDAVVRYEDFVVAPERALAALRRVDPGLSSLTPTRTAYEVAAGARGVPGLAAGYGSEWGRGNVDPRGFDHRRMFKRVSRDVHARVAALCPTATADSDAYLAAEVPRWRLAYETWWGDVVYPRARHVWSISRRHVRQTARSLR